MYTSTVTHKILVLRYISSCFIMFATSFLRLGSPSVTGPSSKRLGKNSGNLSLGTGLRARRRCYGPGFNGQRSSGWVVGGFPNQL